MIQLGDEVRDRVTGFRGTVVCRSEWLHGCIRITVQPKAAKDKMPDAITFDEPTLEVVKAAKPFSRKTDTGGPRPEPHRQENPRR